MTSLTLPTILFAGLAFAYWAYKKIREPAYKPGMIATWAAKAEDDDLSKKINSTNEPFDDPSLYQKSTIDKWIMPHGIEIYYFPTIKSKSKSNAATPTIALHGGPSIAPIETWKELSNEIPDFYLYHARGCGMSTRPFHKFPTPKMWPGMKILEETLGIGQQVADIERIRRRLQHKYQSESGDYNSSNVPFQINLVGHSFGGFIATLYASEFPQHVKSLILMAPAGVMKIPGPPEHDLFKTIKRKLEENDDYDDATRQQYLHDYDDWFKEYMDFGSLPQQTEETLAKRQADIALHYERAVYRKHTPVTTQKSQPLDMVGGMACYASFMSMGMEHDYRDACKERLQQSTFPVTIVHGCNDTMSPQSISRDYCTLFPSQNVNYQVLEGADHFVFDHPGIVSIVKDAVSK